MSDQERWQRYIIFWRRTGHCHLLSHLHRLKSSHRSDSPCGSGFQDPIHILRNCPMHAPESICLWPSGTHCVEINWGAMHHSPVPQGHQHSALSCDQGTFERRRKAGSYAVWWQIQASKVRNDCCFSLLVSGFGTLVNKSKRKIRRQLKWWDSHLCVSFTPALIGEACGLLTTKWSTLYNFAACLWLIHLMATCHILQIPLHKTVPCLPAGAQHCAVCMTYLKMPAENTIAVKAACK